MTLRHAQAGSLESGDALVRVSLTESDSLDVLLSSKVSSRFSKSIDQAIREVASEMEIRSAIIEVRDGGALDFVLRARLVAAFSRALGGRHHE